MLTHLGLSPSFGFGDRLGFATLGHIAAVRGTKFAPIFAQQSVRENARTGRSPQLVSDVGWTPTLFINLLETQDVLPAVEAGSGPFNW